MKAKKPMVSVIMSVYNGEKTLQNAIDSILNQTYTNWELVICDDCSTDSSMSILNNYKNKYPEKFIVLHNDENKKLPYSLNRCLKTSSGEYIARMDADDISLPLRFEKQVDFLNAHPDIDVVGANTKVFNGISMNTERRSKEYPEKEDLLLGLPFMHPTIMMRKSVYDDLHGYTVSKITQRGQDIDLWARFFANGYKGYNLQEPLLIYHETDDDFKKRKFVHYVNYSRIKFNSFRILHFPFYKYIFALKPILSFFVPQFIKRARRGE